MPPRTGELGDTRPVHGPDGLGWGAQWLCEHRQLPIANMVGFRNLRNVSTAELKQGDLYLDWYGAETTQPERADGTPMDWTVDTWPAEWGEPRSVAVHGFGEEPLNRVGRHYWMLDVDMDCMRTAAAGSR